MANETTQRKRDFNRYLALRSEYGANFEPTHRQINDFIYPQGGKFDEEGTPNDGSRKDEYIINSTATIALRTLVSGIWGAITSPANKWVNLTIDDKVLREDASVKEYFAEVTDILLSSLGKSNFYTAIEAVYAGICAFGTGVVQMEADVESIFRFTPFIIGQYYIDTGASGRVDYVAQVIQMRARNVIEKFGEENVSDKVKNAVRSNNAGETYVDILHIQQRNTDRDVSKLDSKNKLYSSRYWEMNGNDDSKPLRESGYDTKPFAAFRWSVRGSNTWGTGPGELGLPDTKELQTLAKDRSRALAKQVEPPLVALGSAGSLDINTAADGITYVDGITQGQQPALSPAYQVNTNLADLDASIAVVERRLMTIFFADLFFLLSSFNEKTQTATEVIARTREQLRLLGPIIERLIPEGFENIISRGYDILNKMGRLPEPPEIIRDRDIKIEIISLISQAQEQTAVAPIEQLYATVRAMSETHPEVLDVFNADNAAREVGTALGTVPDVLNSVDEVLDFRLAKAKQAQELQEREQAQAVTGMAKELSETETSGNNALAAVTGAV